VIAETSERALPMWLLNELQSPPTADRHSWFFWCAVRLLGYRSQDVTLELLRGAARHVGRFVPDRELRDAVKDAVRWKANHGPAATPLERLQRAELRWPAYDLPQLDRIVRVGPRRKDLPDLSKKRFSPDSRHTEEIADLLYAGNPLLCCAKSARAFATRRREIWRGHLHRLPLIVPSPMNAVRGRTDEGTGPWSEHTLQNTGPRHYLVLEFDFTEFSEDGNDTNWAPLIRGWRNAGISIQDACAALLMHLAKCAPLVLIVFSGGKSLHGWFACLGADERQLRLWMADAVRLGACKSTWTRSQFVRMPDGTRENARQTVEFYNPGLLA
jgi:hypothetical protein